MYWFLSLFAESEAEKPTKLTPAEYATSTVEKDKTKSSGS